MQPPQPDVFAFIKIGQKAHMESLRSKGELYLSTWQFFKDHEKNNDAIGDRDEGTKSIHQVARGASVSVAATDGRFSPLKNLVGQIKLGFGQEVLEQCNLFCVFALTKDSHRFLADPRLLKFGDTAVIFTCGDEFLRRFREHLKNDSIEYENRLVEYMIQDLHDGNMGAFRKFQRYDYQSEFRLVALTQKKEPVTHVIGDLSDISVICPSSELAQQLPLSLLV